MNVTDRAFKSRLNVRPGMFIVSNSNSIFSGKIPDCTFSDGGRRHWEIVYWATTLIGDCTPGWLRAKWRLRYRLAHAAANGSSDCNEEKKKKNLSGIFSGLESPLIPKRD